MPFPSNLEQLEAEGYRYSRTEDCPVCRENVEVFSTPGGRTIAMNPMTATLSPAIRHYETCRAPILPKTRDGLMGAVYLFLGRMCCERCNRAVERYKSPDGEMFTFDPMMEEDWPVVVHSCNNRTNPVEAPPAVSPVEPSPEPPLVPLPPPERPQIKLYGVTDKNIWACGWQDGTLEIAFRHGKYQYANVPENIFVTLRKVPHPNNYFTKVVKNHPELYPYTKLS